VLSNKFEYGYDTCGGRKFASTDTFKKAQLEKNEINKIVGTTQAKYAQAEANRANDAKQNFEIKPVKSLLNSTSKVVGEHGNNTVDNIIDQNDLKISHMPFKKTAVAQGSAPQRQIHAAGGMRQVAAHIKTQSE